MKGKTKMKRETIVAVYQAAETSSERDETIKELANESGLKQFQIRQILQEEKVYVEKEGRTEKESYAYALSCVTGIDQKEFMKLSLKAAVKLMGVFRGDA